jgi:Flp pilus assembly protein TadD
MKREQLAFLAAGIVLGFVGGFAVAWGTSHAPAAGPAMPAPRAPAAAPDDSGEATMTQVTEQIAALKRRIEEHPGDPEPLVELANLYLQAGMYPQAQEHLERAVDLAPGDVHARTHLGIVLGQTGDLEGARRQFEAVVGAEPDDWQGWFYLAVTSARMGETERARQAAARVEALNPTLPELAELKRHLEEAKRGSAPRGDG